MQLVAFWPYTDVPIALAHVCSEGEERKWRGLAAMSLNDPGRVKTLRGITAPGILRLVVTLRARKCKNSSSAQRYNQIRFRFHTA